MELNKILTDYLVRPSYRRQVGRYWSSEVEYIRKKYVTPESFFEAKPIDIDGTRMILTGMAMENLLTDIFKKQGVDCKFQSKKVMHINREIDLVVKPDFEFPKFLVETKYPFSIVKQGEIPERYKYQLECEYRAFEKPVYLGVFTIPFNVEFIEYEPSKRRWNNIKKVLVNFHHEVKKIDNQRRELQQV